MLTPNERLATELSADGRLRQLEGWAVLTNRGYLLMVVPARQLLALERNNLLREVNDGSGAAVYVGMPGAARAMLAVLERGAA